MSKKTVLVELYDSNYRHLVDFTDDVNSNALDQSESLCLGIYCQIPITNGGKYGSYDVEINDIKKSQFSLSTLHSDVGSVLKAFGKYAANFTLLGQYEIDDRLFRAKQ